MNTKSEKKQTKSFQSTKPIYFLSEYKNSYKEIVYELNDYTKLQQIFYPVEFKNYLRKDKQWENYKFLEQRKIPYAFGILTNPYYSRMILLDFDSSSFSDIKELATSFFVEEVNAIDIIRSSYSSVKYPKNYHMVIGLNDYYNVYPFYKRGFPYCCRGFIKSITDKHGECILRISDKKEKIVDSDKLTYNLKPNLDTIPKWLTSFRKINNNWYYFDENQIEYPKEKTLNTIKNNDTCDKTKVKIQIRGKNANKNTKQKSKRKETSTISSVEDIISIPLSF